MRALVLSALSLVAITQVQTAHAQAWRHPYLNPYMSSAQSSTSSVSSVSSSAISKVMQSSSQSSVPSVQGAPLEFGRNMVPANDAMKQDRTPITRSAFAAIVMDRFYSKTTIDHCYWDIASDLPPRFTLVFNDVHVNMKNAHEICIAMRDGIIRGYGDGTFRPEKTITFAEASKMLSRAYELAPYAETESDIGPWYGAYTNALSMRSAIPASIKSLNQIVTTADIAEIMNRLDNDIRTLPATTYTQLETANHPKPKPPAPAPVSRATTILVPHSSSSKSNGAMSSKKSMMNSAKSVSSVMMSKAPSSSAKSSSASSRSSIMSKASSKTASSSAKSSAAASSAKSEDTSKWLKWY